MSMLSLTGKVHNVFHAPEGVKKDGTKYGGQSKVQIMAENELQNGEVQSKLLDLTVESISQFKELVGEMVRIPVGVYVQSGQPAFYILKNAKPEVI